MLNQTLNQSISQCTLRTALFQGTVEQPVLDLNNTRNVTVEQTIFSDIQSRNSRIIHAHSSQISVKQTIFTDLVTENAISAVSSSVAIDKCRFTNITAPKIPASFTVEQWFIVHIKEESHITITDSQFINNKEKYAGCICVGNATVSVENTEFSGNVGQILRAKYKHVVNIDSCRFTNITVTNTDFIYIDGGSGSITNSVFSNNQVALYASTFLELGRCVHIDGSNVTVENTEFIDNKARGVTYCKGGSMSLMNVTISHNKGRFIHTESCTVNISFSRFINNSGISYHKRDIKGSNLTISDSVFRDNRAPNGGVFPALENSHLVISLCRFEGNRASQSGGVITATTSTIMIQNTEFGDNECSNDGGVIKVYFKTSIDVTNSNFISNKASDGGAIIIEDDCRMTTQWTNFTNNTSTSGGGAIMVLDHSHYTDDGSSFISNTAADTGGAMAVMDHSDIKLNNTTFIGNKATSQYNGLYNKDCPPVADLEQDGGAVIVQTYSNATINRCHFTENQASHDGGAIYVKRRSFTTITYSKFKFNSAMKSGGSIMIQHSQLNIESCSFEDKSVIAGYGGSIATETVGNTTIKHSIFFNCRALTGGTIAVQSESFMSIEHSMVNESYANSSGGGFCVSQKSFLTSSNLTLHGCKSRSGAGIEVAENSEMKLDMVRLLLNRATESGGAIQCKQSKITLDEGNIEGNIARKDGGGLHNEYCDTIINNITFINNYASHFGGGIFVRKSGLEIHNVDEHQNMAGIKGHFVLITDESKLLTQNMKLSGSDSTITVANMSHAVMKHTKIIDINGTSYCPISAISDSHVDMTSVYFANNGNSSDEWSSPVCVDGTKSESGSRTEAFPESCETECNCYSDHKEKALVADCSNSGLTHLPNSLPEDFDWLLLSGNNISSIDAEGTNITYLYSISRLDLRESKVRYLSSEFLEIFVESTNLQQLDISNNEITYVPKNVVNITSLENLTLIGNDLKCDCNSTWMKNWFLNNSDIIQDYKSVQCEMPFGKLVNVIQMSEVDMNCFPNIGYFPIWVVVGLVAVGIVITVIVAVIARNWEVIKFWIFLCCGVKFQDKVEMVENIADIDYDAFINFNCVDNNFVREEVVRFLEDHGYTLCIHTRDFVPTATIVHNITLSIQHSRRMIAVVTRNYLNSDWCKEEFMLGHLEAVTGRYKYIILIMMDDINVGDLPDEMQKYVKTHTYIDAKNLRNRADMDMFRNRLLYSMPKTPIKDFDVDVSDEYNPNVPPLFNRMYQYKEVMEARL